jgi:hypothetical protein
MVSRLPMLRSRRLLRLPALLAVLAAACLLPAGAALAAGTTSTVPTTQGFTVTAPATPAPASQPAGAGIRAATHGGGGISNAAIALAAAGALLVLGCAAWAIHRLGGFQARWTLSLRHSVDEAGYRVAETAAELRDWARLGR